MADRAMSAPVARRSRGERLRPGRIFASLVRYGFLGFFAALCVLPMIIVVSAAVKDPNVATGDPFRLFSSIRLENFNQAWTQGHFGQYFWNTIVIMVPTVLGVLVLSTMAGYALARFDFRGRSVIFVVFILGLMVPFFSLMIPLYYNLRDYHLLDTPWAVILPSIAGAGGTGLPLGIFLMRAFFLDMPDELGDAARVDGCGEFGVFGRIMVPLAVPGFSALAILTFLSAWNTFLLPLLYLQGQDNRTLATGLLLFAGGRTREIELTAAATLIMIAPVVVFFVLFQRQFIRGLTSGAVKG